MKLVTLKGRFSKICYNCGAEIKPGDKAYRVIGTGRPGARKYYCKKCGDIMEHG